jgi:uncharacterized protein (TIGR00255 family)
MTGYGKAGVTFGAKVINIEIKSINSKQLDLTLRLPALYREKEPEIRSMVALAAERGKMELTITIESVSDSEEYVLNQPLAERYYQNLKRLATAIGEEKSCDLLPVIARLPDVFKATLPELNPDEWQAVSEGLSAALNKMNICRKNEGEILCRDMTLRVNNILSYLAEIEPFEKERIETLRSKLRSTFVELENQVNFDENRFEQELIYYIEKLDITEEKIRLKKHCDYFFQTIDEPVSAGKKLGFIAQEMGREINTLGSKASHFEVQRLVVLMKDELEKIKEQLLNIL